MPTRLNFSLTKEKNAFKNTALTDIKNNANRSTCLIKKIAGTLAGICQMGHARKMLSQIRNRIMQGNHTKLLL